MRRLNNGDSRMRVALLKGLSTLALAGALIALSQNASAQQPGPRGPSGPPTYYVLRAPASPAPHHPSMHGARQGYIQPVARRPYAYGWFGATPRRHEQWVRHFGYHRAYTQWSTR